MPRKTGDHPGSNRYPARGSVPKVGVARLLGGESQPESARIMASRGLLPPSASSIAVSTIVRPLPRDASLSAGSGAAGSESSAWNRARRTSGSTSPRPARKRPDDRGGDRPDRPPQEARPVPRGVLPRAQRAHAGRVGAQKSCRAGAQAAQIPMTILLKGY